MLEEKKSHAIDYVKCIGIVLVIFGHYPNTIINVLKPYMYHMPLFFFLGGMLFSTKKGSKKHYYNIIVKYAAYIIISYLLLGLSVKASHYFFGTQDKVVFIDNIFETAFLY